MTVQTPLSNNASKRACVAWFRCDLRLNDNPMLHTAAERSSGHVIPIYCFDPRHYGKTRFGFPKTGRFRTKFITECVRDLQQHLRRVGSDLVVFNGQPETVLPSLVRHLATEYDEVDIVYNKEVCSEEMDVENGVARALKQETHASDTKARITPCTGGHTMFHPSDLPYPVEELPNVCTDFRKRVEKSCTVRAPLSPPTNLQPIPQGVRGEPIPSVQALLADHGDENVDSHRQEKEAEFVGGITHAHNRLRYYFWEKEFVQAYKETRNGMLRRDDSTKFSPWLAQGCISAREIYHELKRYESERVSNQSTYWVFFELVVRDFFRFASEKYGNAIFHLRGPAAIVQAKKKSGGGSGQKPQQWSRDTDRFRLWSGGRTGYPMVDANMRELSSTGFMSNRGRQNVASFLAKDLGLDWRMGAEWFESLLIDHDPCQNYGNWTYVAGVGDDPRQDRYFNVLKQSRQYDPTAEYIKHWLPELRCLSDGDAHDPSSVLESTRERMGDALAAYPRPCVRIRGGGGRGGRGGEGKQRLDKMSRGGIGEQIHVIDEDGRGGSGGGHVRAVRGRPRRSRVIQ